MKRWRFPVRVVGAFVRTAVVAVGLLGCAAGQVSCRTADVTAQFRNGDLIFRLGAGEGMTDAIVAATGHGAEVPYSHVGLVERRDNGIFVIEATGDGVCRTPLTEFLAGAAHRDGQPLVAVGRLTGVDTATVGRAMRRATGWIGLPYDDDFLPANGKLYCSELVWEAYVADDGTTHLLQSYPMNFRAADGSMPVYWTEHFAALGMEVPEGVAGTNPNDMAHDPAVEILYRYYVGE